jgi:MFS family permease
MFLLWRMDVHTTNAQAARNMVVAGIGIGSMMQVFVISVQNAVRRQQMGSATALTQFARSIGATVGVTVMGVIVNQGLPPQLHGGTEAVAVHRLPPRLRDDLANALHPAFLAAFCVALVVWVIAFVGVKEVPLRRGFEDEPAEVAAADAQSRNLATVDASGAPR